ncbi:hypothetical protein KEM55_003680 [Ascosphaera atra]|nr:hypothetical protein KEM55_003680 [Ascosphaera atra]
MDDHFDHISLKNISTSLNVKPDAWGRENVPQPALISVKVSYPPGLIHTAYLKDDVKFTLDYGKLYRAIAARLAQRSAEASSIDEIAQDVVGVCFAQLEVTLAAQDESGFWSQPLNHSEVELSIYLPKAILRADGGLTYRLRQTGPGGEASKEYSLHGARCYVVLGVNPHERLQKQRIEITLTLKGYNRRLEKLQGDSAVVLGNLEDTQYRTVEALAEKICEFFLADNEADTPVVTVSIEKPSAMPFVECSVVEITRRKSDYK